MVDYQKEAHSARLKILEMIYEAGSSHIGSVFSAVDIFTVLFLFIMKKEDKFICSPGWKAAGVYYFLARIGEFPMEDLKNYNKDGKMLGLLSSSVKGVVTSTGAAGHGLPIAVGIAKAKKIKEEKGNVYCLMSDGEMNCGTTWESAALAAHSSLDNLIVIIDKNNWQATGRPKNILDMEPLKDKWKSFNWFVDELNGHDFLQIENGLHNANYIEGLPKVIIAETIKGKGVSFMEDKLEWHYKNIDKETYERAIFELVG